MSDEPPQTPQPQRPPMQPIPPGYPNYPLHPSQPQQPYSPHSPRASNNPLRPAFWRNMSTLKISVITAVSTVLLVTVCIVPLLLTGALASLYQPRHKVFDIPLPLTRPPQPLSGATLGGTVADFFAKYGQPVALPSFSQKPNWFRFKLANGTTAYVCYCDGATGTDGAARLDDFRISPPSGTTWSDQQGVSIARQFFPPDARHVRDIVDPYAGLIHVYVSAALAATFPASEFHVFTVGGNSQLAPPGTFSIVCGQPALTPCGVTTGD